MSRVWDPLDPELDASPPRASPPSTTYFVCSTPRTGSGLLCRGLLRTGVAGAPAEYFSRTFRDPLARRWETGRDLEPYVLALRARRTGANGVFGAKVHWSQLEDVTREVVNESGIEALFRWFPRATAVSIEREDVNGQAVSWWVALHTDVWSTALDAPESKPVPYSFDAIFGLRRAILGGRDAWAAAFAAAGVEPIRVSYTELSGSFQPTIARVVEAVAGVTIDPSDIALPESRKQADAHSAELVRRFEADLRAGRHPSALVGKAQTVFRRRLWRLARAAR